MSPITSAAIYFVLWWLSLYLVLPFGIENQPITDGRTKGSAEGAPSRPQMRKKLLQATILSSILFAIFYALVHFEILTFEKLNVVEIIGL